MAVVCDLSDKVGFERYLGGNPLHWYGRNIWRSGHYFEITENYDQRQSMAGVRLTGISINYSIESLEESLTDLKMEMCFTYKQDVYVLKWLSYKEAKSLSMGSSNTVEFEFGSDKVLEIASLSLASFSIQTSFSDYTGDTGTAIIINSIEGTLEEPEADTRYGSNVLTSAGWSLGVGWSHG